MSEYTRIAERARAQTRRAGIRLLDVVPPRTVKRLGPHPLDSWWLRWYRLNLATFRASRPVQGRML